MAHRTFTALAAAGLLSLSGLSCGQQRADPNVELLSVTRSSDTPLTYEYHLFGDGRLVREIVHEYDKQPDYRRERVVRARDEVKLSAAAVESIIHTPAASRLLGLLDKRAAGHWRSRVIESPDFAATRAAAEITSRLDSYIPRPPMAAFNVATRGPRRETR